MTADQEYTLVWCQSRVKWLTKVSSSQIWAYYQLTVPCYIAHVPQVKPLTAESPRPAISVDLCPLRHHDGHGGDRNGVSYCQAHFTVHCQPPTPFLEVSTLVFLLDNTPSSCIWSKLGSQGVQKPFPQKSAFEKTHTSNQGQPHCRDSCSSDPVIIEYYCGYQGGPQRGWRRDRGTSLAKGKATL